MLRCEICGRTPWLVIGDEVDVALAPELGIFRPVACDLGETHGGKGIFEDSSFCRAEFKVLKAVQPKWIF